MQFSYLERLLNSFTNFKRNRFLNPKPSGRFLGGQPLNFQGILSLVILIKKEKLSLLDIAVHIISAAIHGS